MVESKNRAKITKIKVIANKLTILTEKVSHRLSCCPQLTIKSMNAGVNKTKLGGDSSDFAELKKII